MTSSCSGRKCLRSVSRVGPSTPRPPASPNTSIQPTAVNPGSEWSVAAILVVLAAGLGLAAMLVTVLALRRKRLRGQQDLLVVRGDGGAAAGKPGQGELEGVEKEGMWSAGPGAVELVVMAGETKPTYLATPTIQCPPLKI